MGCCSSTASEDGGASSGGRGGDAQPAGQPGRSRATKQQAKSASTTGGSRSGESGGGVSQGDVSVQLTETQGGNRRMRNIHEDYQVQKRIGEGNYSTVHLAVHKRTRKKVAVKIANKAQLTQEDIDAVYVEVDVLREVNCAAWTACCSLSVCV